LIEERLRIKAPLAGETLDPAIGAMQLNDSLLRQSGHLVQPINVLRNHGQQLSGTLQVHNREMDSIRLRIAHRRPGLQFVMPIFDPRLLRSQELVIINWLPRLPDALWPAEIGDSAVGGDARASKDEEGPRLLKNVD